MRLSTYVHVKVLPGSNNLASTRDEASNPLGCHSQGIVAAASSTVASSGGPFARTRIAMSADQQASSSPSMTVPVPLDEYIGLRTQTHARTSTTAPSAPPAHHQPAPPHTMPWPGMPFAMAQPFPFSSQPPGPAASQDRPPPWSCFKCTRFAARQGRPPVSKQECGAKQLCGDCDYNGELRPAYLRNRQVTPLPLAPPSNAMTMEAAVQAFMT